jgi:hypothetical protein
MLQAQIHHKVPRDFEGMEDVLTSSTIGLLSYLPGALAAAVVAELAQIPVADVAIGVELWPSHATPPGFRRSAHPDDDSEEGDSARGDTEPDAVIRCGGWLVMLEAKYHSPLDEEYNQLGREFAIGFNEARRNGLHPGLLVLTAHILPPTPGGVSLVEGVQRALENTEGAAPVDMVAAVPDSLRWANWQRFYGILKRKASDPGHEPHTRRLLEDACKILELHGLVPYDGAGIEEAMLKWQSSGIPGEAWASPLVYRSRTMASLQLEDFELSSLQPIEWQPYQQGGNTS